MPDLARFDRRFFMAGGIAAAGCATNSTSPAFDARVGPGGHASVAEAIVARPAEAANWRVLVGPGRWREKLVIDKPNIALVGADRHASVLTFDDASRTPGPDGRPLGTFRSYSIAVQAPGFSARNLTIENAFDFDAAARQPPPTTPDPNGGPPRITDSGLQAVALALGDGADKSLFVDCDITGHQDTLYTNRGRSLFRNCKITGTTDFIFGAGRALFQSCEIVSRTREMMPQPGRWGWVSAASTLREQPYGLVFSECRLTHEPGVPAHSVGLGRFWRPTTDFPDGRYGNPDAVGASVFLECWLGDHIIPEGWDSMGYNAKGGVRSQLTPQEARPGEYRSRGPGAGARAFQLSPEQAQIYSPALVLDGWAPNLS